MKQKLEIHLIGPFPPPYGGISVHIERISSFLHKKNMAYKIFDQYGKSDENVVGINNWFFWLFKSILNRKKRLSHIHFPSPTFLPYYIIFCIYSHLVPGSLVITLHNDRLLGYSKTIFNIYMFVLKLIKVEHVLVVSEKLSLKLIASNVKKVKWLPAYVPPQIGKRIKRKSKDSPTENKKIFMNIWRLQDKSYIQQYGIDFFYKLAKEFPQHQFELYIGSNKNIDLLYGLQKQLETDNIVIHIGRNLVEFLGQCDYFIRPNRVDAFGISIQEALDLGVPAIASNVCTRAPGAILFKTDDYNNLKSVFEKALNSKKEDLLSGVENSRYHIELLEIYEDLFSR